MSVIIIITRPRPPAQGGGTERIVMREKTHSDDDIEQDTEAAITVLQGILEQEN